MTEISESELTRILERTVKEYGAAMRSLADGLSIVESEIGPATEAIRKEFDRLRAERDMWKANHDNQVAIKRAVVCRPDLPMEDKDRAILRHALHTQYAISDELADDVARLTTERDMAIKEISATARNLGYAEAALGLIAAPMRPDGTYNRDRAACGELARATLEGRP